MRCWIRRADVEVISRWSLDLFEMEGLWRVEVTSPAGELVYSKSLVKTSEEALESARLFLVGERLDHVGGVLCQLARNEMQMSNGQEVTT